ncbi:hypothetical protein ACFVY4_33600 [Streptomyces sp. NPDC058299]|uniref:hypothetical protein n=1 Tax=Streptomyces sp. NPDC058299 TaxID=3346435 RepID=UPI0036E6183B
MADTLDDKLLALERSAEEERVRRTDLAGEESDAQWRRWRDTAERAQAAVTAHAETTGANPYELSRP